MENKFNEGNLLNFYTSLQYNELKYFKKFRSQYVNFQLNHKMRNRLNDENLKLLLHLTTKNL